MSKMNGKCYNNLEKEVFLARKAREDFPEEVTCNWRAEGWIRGGGKATSAGTKHAPEP